YSYLPSAQLIFYLTIITDSAYKLQPVVYTIFFFFLIIPRPPISTLFPYTTLFRSVRSPGPTSAAPEITVIVPSELTTTMPVDGRSEEHTSELQSRGHLVCRLLLEKKKKKI